MTRKLNIVVLLLLASSFSLRAQYYGNIEFVENKGQWDNQVKFRGDVGAVSFFVRARGFTVLQHNPQDFERMADYMHGGHTEGSNSAATRQAASSDGSMVLRSHAFNVDFLNSSSDYELIPDKPVDSYNNYFYGNDPSKWAGHCKIYQGITVKNIYPNVDLRYYTDAGQLKYDIIARPGADINKIALRYDGVDRLETKSNELRIATSVGEMKELKPYTYQFDGKERRDINCKYVVKDNVVRFAIKDYDPNATLIIDPTIVFVSLSRSTGDNWGFTATYGPDGSMFGGGISLHGNFPVSTGAFQTTFGGGNNNPVPEDIAIIKLSPNGANRIYATYIGGSGNDQPHSLIVDAAGNLIVAGRTSSPTTNTGGGIPYPLKGNGTGMTGPTGGYDIVVTMLDPSGSNLIGSRRIGGAGDDGVNISSNRSGTISLQRNYGDDGRSEVILDNAGNIFVASCTRSTTGSGLFPVVGGFQGTPGGAQDGVVIKLTPGCSDVLFSSFLGGGGDDAAYVLAISPLTGNVFVGGGTASDDFPGNKTGTIKPTNPSGIDGFVAEITPNGNTLVRSTYLGTGGVDQVFGVQFDREGFPYVMGQTTGAWPIVNAAFSNAGAKQFIAKLQPDLSAFVYSTVFGTNAATPNISPVAFLVDRCENVYVSGWGGFFNNQNEYNISGTTGMPVTPDAFKPTTDGKDFYFFVLEKDAAGILFASYFGENNTPTGGSDHVDGGTSRFDANGVIYQAICGNCKSLDPNAVFPTTPGVWGPNNPSNGCNLAMVKIAFNLAGVGSGIRSSINGVPRDTAGCVPLTVDFSDTVRRAKSYEWNFGDGSPQITTIGPDTSHTFTAVGKYRVMLVAIDSTTCNIRDTSYVNIKVGDLEAILAMNPEKQQPCDEFKYVFHNTSTAPAARPFTNTSFIWDFGDGTARVTAGSGDVNHTFAGPGTYIVRLILNDTAYCNYPDSIELELRVAALVEAQFETPDAGCAPYDAVFNNTSLAGQQFIWDFGDGGTSDQINPTHTYNLAGTYTVTLIAIDPATCNGADTTTKTISVADQPTANFTFAPVPPVENSPTTFTNSSSPDAVAFAWYFGDGDSLLTNSRAQVNHQYRATGTFNACLVATNANGCSDTLCQPVDAIIDPLVAVPNAFTPNSGDVNSVVMVRGFGIAKMKFVIYNRWGQKVFESQDQNLGWDGRFKGVLQPMDVYAYTLEAEFFDGTKTTKTGDITLIR